MKVIDLLNKIANGEENDLQTEFEFDGKVYNFFKFNHSEYCLDYWLLNQNITITKHKEILKEPKGIPEKLDIGKMLQTKKWKRDKKTWETINSIIDYLESKGE